MAAPGSGPTLRDFIDAPRLTWEETKDLIKQRDNKVHQLEIWFVFFRFIFQSQLQFHSNTIKIIYLKYLF